MLKKTRIIFLYCFSLNAFSFAQPDSLISTKSQRDKLILAGSSGALTVGSLVYLNQAWYADYKTSSFHFFNDNNEWLHMDKVGHLFTNYQMSRLMMNAFERVGYSKKKSLFIGGEIGLAYMTAIECMDGFSKGWGFSWGDEIANILGTSVAISQQAFWREQRFQLKFSYAKSGLAQYNPSLLGKSAYTQILKDYNAQTYWLSANISAFLKKENKFPKWLNLAFGYGAYGMLGGYTNNFVVQDENGNVLKFDRVRRYYLSIDIDWTKIKTKSKFLKSVFSVLNMVKVPAPTLQFSENKIKFLYLYQ
jgi:hypothetical protein